MFLLRARTSQEKSSPPNSLLSSPFKKMSSACSYNKKLRITMEVSAREQGGPNKEEHVE